MNTKLCVVALIALFWCDAACYAASESGELLFSFHTIESSSGGDSVKGVNFSFYVNKAGLITGHYIKNGSVRDVFGGGTDSSNALRKQLKSLAFESMDFEAELRTAVDSYREVTKQNGGNILVPTVLDGAEVEIRYNFEGVDFVLKRWSPQVEIDFYAPYSQKIKKLQALIDIFALHFGRSMFRL